MTFFIILFTNVNGQNEKMTIYGDVIAYVEKIKNTGEESSKLLNIPNREILFLKVKTSKNIKGKFIKVVYEYFDEKPLPENIYSGSGKWKFQISRRPDCDSVLNPDYSNLKLSNKDGENWVDDPSPVVKFTHPEESQNIPSDKILHCYSLLSLTKF